MKQPLNHHLLTLRLKRAEDLTVGSQLVNFNSTNWQATHVFRLKQDNLLSSLELEVVSCKAIHLIASLLMPHKRSGINLQGGFHDSTR